MSLHGVLKPRISINLIVRCWRAIRHREVHRQRVLVPATTVIFARITSLSSRAVSVGTVHEDLIDSTLKHTFSKSSVATGIIVGTKGIVIKYLPSSKKAWIAEESLHGSPMFRRGVMIAKLKRSGPRESPCRTPVRDKTMLYMSEAWLGSK
jgi:hypothetical protein